MGCMQSKDDRGTHMDYFRSAIDDAEEKLDEASDAFSDIESNARSAASDIEDGVDDVQTKTEKEVTSRRKQVDNIKATTSSTAQTAQKNSRAYQRQLRRKALLEKKSKMEELSAAKEEVAKNAQQKKSHTEDAIKVKEEMMKTDGRRRSNKYRTEVEDIISGSDDTSYYESTRTMSSFPSLPSLAASGASDSLHLGSFAAASISSKGVKIEINPVDDFYQGEQKHALILSLALYSQNQASVNTKANQLRTILLNYMNYEEDMIRVVTNSILSNHDNIYSYVESYLEESISSEHTHHFFIAIVTDNSIIGDDISEEKIMEEEQMPNDVMLMQIASMTNEYTSFCFYLDSPFMGVLPTLQYRAIGDELLESPHPDEDIICSMMAISACSMRTFRGDPYIDAYGGNDGSFTEQIAAFARSDRIESYNWFSFVKQLQQRLEEGQFVSVAANKRYLLEMPVSL